jgi:hypothetical protein
MALAVSSGVDTVWSVAVGGMLAPTLMLRVVSTESPSESVTRNRAVCAPARYVVDVDTPDASKLPLLVKSHW